MSEREMSVGAQQSGRTVSFGAVADPIGDVADMAREDFVAALDDVCHLLLMPLL